MKTISFQSDSRFGSITGWIISAALHAVAALVMLDIGGSTNDHPPDTTVQMTIVEKKKPEPVSLPQENETISKPQKIKPRTIKLSKATPPLPPSNQKRPKSPPAKISKPVFGISMSSVVKGSGPSTPGMTVRVGNTLAASPSQEFTDPNEVQPYQAPNRILRKHTYQAVPTYKLTSLPKPKRLIKANYPEQARSKGIEGEIILRLTIDEKGWVQDAVIVKGIGHGLDELTLAAAKAFRFEPARIENQPVSTIIPFTYRWKIID